MITRRMLVLLCSLLAASPLVAIGTARAQELQYRTEHFVITWSADARGSAAIDTHDRDHNGVPDSVERMAAAFEAARRFELGSLGYQEPPTGGRYPLYVSATTDSGYTRTRPGGSGNLRPSFTVIPTYLMQSDASTGQLKAFAGHEYFHAIQNGYDASEDPWIKEASSSWMEGRFAPHAHHEYGYLPFFIPNLDAGLTSQGGLHEYGAFLFLQYLTERYGGGPVDGAGIVKELWEDMAVPEAVPGAPDDDALGAISRVLTARGTTLAAAWREFLVWNWQLDRFAEGRGYQHAVAGTGWPTASTTSVGVESCRLETPSTLLPAVSGSYERFLPGHLPARLARLTVEGPTGSVATAVVKRRSGPSEVRDLTFDGSGLATTDLDFGGNASGTVTLAVGNATTAESGPIAYSLRSLGERAVQAGSIQGSSSIVWGSGVRLSGVVMCNGIPAPHAAIQVTKTEGGSSTTFDLTTDDHGMWSLIDAPQSNATFSATVVDPLISSATSSPFGVGVHEAVMMELNSDQVTDGSPIELHGTAMPVHPVTVLVQFRRPSGDWQTGPSVETDDAGSYDTAFVLPGPGDWEVRTVVPDTGDGDHLPGNSVPRLVSVAEAQ
ncbi:MAG: hypothetical protein ABR579_01295 [Actinomycetota bacterium]